MILSRTTRVARCRAFLQLDVAVAITVLALVFIPLSVSSSSDLDLARRQYFEAVALQLIDGEMDVLLAGERRKYTPGEHQIKPVGEAVQNIGDLPLVTVDSSSLTGDFDNTTSTITETCAGSYRIGYEYAEQNITLSSSTALADLDGSFRLALKGNNSCGNGTSLSIGATATAAGPDSRQPKLRSIQRCSAADTRASAGATASAKSAGDNGHPWSTPLSARTGHASPSASTHQCVVTPDANVGATSGSATACDASTARAACASPSRAAGCTRCGNQTS